MATQGHLTEFDATTEEWATYVCSFCVSAAYFINHSLHDLVND